ncbi:PIG-L family deacetylase [soil metagenome]
MGTLLKLHARGARVTIVSISDGGHGAFHDPKLTRSIAEIRASEARSVAARMEDGEWLTLGAEDGYVYDTPELRNELAAVMRRVGCDLVLAPPPTDYHYDHTTAGQLAFTSSCYAAVSGPEVEGKQLAKTPPVFHFDTIMGLEFEPSCIDISEQIETKKELARLHASQMENMKAIGDWDLVEYIEIVGRFRGLQSGVTYAEAFRPATRWPRVRAFDSFPR